MACTCGDLPAHDHLLPGHVQHEDGSWGPRWGTEPWEIGHVWVDWKKVAREMMREWGST